MRSCFRGGRVPSEALRSCLSVESKAGGLQEARLLASAGMNFLTQPLKKRSLRQTGGGSNKWCRFIWAK